MLGAFGSSERKRDAALHAAYPYYFKPFDWLSAVSISDTVGTGQSLRAPFAPLIASYLRQSTLTALDPREDGSTLQLRQLDSPVGEAKCSRRGNLVTRSICRATLEISVTDLQ